MMNAQCSMRGQGASNGAPPGNAGLEALLFLPFTFLLLFCAIDGGLALSDKAALSEALRSGLNTSLEAAERNPLPSHGDSSLAVTRADLESIIDRVTAQIVRNVQRARGVNSSSPDDFAVSVSAYLLPIDPGSGTQSFSPELIYSAAGGARSFSLREAAPGFAYRSREEFLTTRLAGASLAPSVYATPLVPMNDPISGERAANRYLPFSILIYAEVSALARGIGGRTAQHLLGSYYGIEEQELALLRNQLG